jgi:hypothetical protein
MPSTTASSPDADAGVASTGAAAIVPASCVKLLEHFPEKWTPVFRKKMRPSIESRALFEFDAIGLLGQPSRKAL